MDDFISQEHFKSPLGRGACVAEHWLWTTASVWQDLKVRWIYFLICETINFLKSNKFSSVLSQLLSIKTFGSCSSSRNWKVVEEVNQIGKSLVDGLLAATACPCEFYNRRCNTDSKWGDTQYFTYPLWWHNWNRIDFTNLVHLRWTKSLRDTGCLFGCKTTFVPTFWMQTSKYNIAENGRIKV